MKSFTASTARPLPVIVLADTSGSMFGSKIDALNNALRDMLASFQEESTSKAEIHLALITFAGIAAQTELEPTPAASVVLPPLLANGATPMGSAFTTARTMLEDKERISGRAYTPAIVLLSDGQPTDTWEQPLQALLGSERARKAQRFALAIGNDADESVLQAFLNDPEQRVFKAHEASQIQKFFRFVTMSIVARSKSANPQASIVMPRTDLDDLE